MIHVSEISAEKRIEHPQDVFKTGQQVKAQVIEVDPAKRQMRLSIKRMLPVSVDEYIADHKIGDSVTGRVVELTAGHARIELGEGIEGACNLPAALQEEQASPSSTKVDLSSLTSMLQAKWKGGSGTQTSAAQPIQVGQIRNFRISNLNPAEKRIGLDLA
jgi:small subunit ribosomal protein S1